jgi:hypothetical protein
VLLEHNTANVTSPTLDAMRQLIPDYRAAEDNAISLETLPNCEELPAFAEARAREEALKAEFDRIWALPVTCFDDIVARAEAAQFWNVSDPASGRIDGANSEYFDERLLYAWSKPSSNSREASEKCQCRDSASFVGSFL